MSLWPESWEAWTGYVLLHRGGGVGLTGPLGTQEGDRVPLKGKPGPLT